MCVIHWKSMSNISNIKPVPGKGVPRKGVPATASICVFISFIIVLAPFYVF